MLKYSNNQSNKSGYKGVTYNRRKKKWEARIDIHGQAKALGYYTTPEDAAQAYNDAALSYYGIKARLNDIPLKKNNTDIFNQKSQK